ncbi:MAG: ketopantoate reductase family protein [Thermomicrobiales bacterium]|jgi:2-dehydropantoate 2-reductase|nr:ketopantoate reductase family protein [Thermomicrobiales bacterium]MDF2760091.1 ketopantoate reductase family protein [Thermomicrobiales bacterium]MDF3015259.1 ketopantoate reductase family protein [Thermomicrobiales bacterium]
MRFVIVGPGALGSVIGATLARRGHDVTLLGRRSPHLQTLRQQGLRLEAPDGTNNRVTIAATDDPAVVSQAETVIVLVKAGDTVPAMAAIQPYIRADQVILTLQNGIGNAEKIRSALGAGPRVLVGVTSQAATRLGPGAVRHAGEGSTLIGVLDKRDSHAAAELGKLFTESGLPSAFVPDIERWIWRKLAINAAINGLTALGGFENGRIASDTSLLDAAEVIAEEVARVARGRGIELGGMRRAILDTAVATASNRSSMLQDLEARRPTEVDAIHGAVLAAAEESGIAIPATQVIAALIRAKETTLMTLEHADGE